MQNIQAPQIELSFYKSGMEKNLMLLTCQSLIDFGVFFAGEAIVCEQTGNDHRCVSINDLSGHQESISYDTLRHYLKNNDKIVIASEWNWIKSNLPDKSILLSYNRISYEAMEKDTHPVMLALSTYYDASIENPSKYDGKNFAQQSKEHEYDVSVYLLFKSIVMNSKPDYAAISVEESVACLSDYRSGQYTMQLPNVYISEKMIDSERIQEIGDQIGEEGCVELFAEGLYICSWGSFNSQGLSCAGNNSITIMQDIFAAM